MTNEELIDSFSFYIIKEHQNKNRDWPPSTPEDDRVVSNYINRYRTMMLKRMTEND